MDKQMFNNTQILAWLQYFSENTQVDLEKVKILDITRKNKNLIPTVESNDAVLVFTEAGHADIFYRMWDAGLGECDVWYNTGSDPSGPIQNNKLRDMMNYNVSAHYGTNRFPGLNLCAKTGTAEVGDGTSHAWFTGFLLDDAHPYAFVVLVENAGGGLTNAGAVANTVLQAAVNK